MVKKKFDFASKEFIIGAIVIVFIIIFASSMQKPLEFKTAVNSQNIEFKGITLFPGWDPNHIGVSCSGQTKSYQFTTFSDKGQPSLSSNSLVAIYWPTFFRPISYVSCENDNGAIILKLNQTDSTITYATVQYK